ncbi:MAG: DUF29 domain-containing protein [Thiomargarita sp.]|nr:DUF29 domain-containing protein [Thiomargarita sp.]
MENINKEVLQSSKFTDFYAWTQKTSQLLLDGNYHQVDMQMLVEEIKAMGASERRELINRLAVLIMHLLKWQYQSGLRSRSWKLTIIEQRREIQELLEDSPSLNAKLCDKFPLAYNKAILKTEKETNLPRKTFSQNCPYTLKQVLDEQFYPTDY